MEKVRRIEGQWHTFKIVGRNNIKVEMLHLIWVLTFRLVIYRMFVDHTAAPFLALLKTLQTVSSMSGFGKHYPLKRNTILQTNKNTFFEANIQIVWRIVNKLI